MLSYDKKFVGIRLDQGSQTRGPRRILGFSSN